MLNWTERTELRGLWWRHKLDNSPTSAARPPAHAEEVRGNTGAAGVTTPTSATRQDHCAPTDSAAPDLQTTPSLWPAYGTATFDPTEGIELDLLGPTGNPFASTEEAATVFGTTTEGDKISLLGCFVRSSTGTLSGLGRHRLTAQALVKGVHLMAMEDLTFCRASFRLRGLRDFLWHARLGAVGMSAQDGERFHRLVQVPGAKLTFGLGWDNLMEAHRQERERVGTVEIELDEPLDFEQWMTRWVRPLQDLVVFATREPSRTEAFAAIVDVEAAKVWWKPEQPPAWEQRHIDFVRRQSPLLADERFGYRRVLFRLGELGAAADTVLAEWFALHGRLDPSAGFLFSTLTSQMFLEQRLLSLTSAAEGYHRAEHDATPLTEARHRELVKQMFDRCANNTERDVYRSPLDHANTLSQRKRLRWLYATAGTVLPTLARDAPRRVTELVETRNYFVHQDQRTPHVLDGAKLDKALDHLLVVLQANLMLDLGIPADWAAQALQHSYEGQCVLAGD